MQCTDLPLHYGRAPKWLFSRMVSLSKRICKTIVLEHSEKELINRLSDPYWFQSLSCVIGFDWHSSGATTTTCGALKEAFKEEELGVMGAGGKGKTSLKTPNQIISIGEKLSLSDKKLKELRYASKASAKVDNTALQDSFNLYHHCIFFTEKGDWCVVQQGLNSKSKYARRYQWNSIQLKDYLNESNKSVSCDKKRAQALNLASNKSNENNAIALDLVKDSVKRVKREFERFSKQRTLFNWKQKPLQKAELRMPKQINWSAVKKAYEFQPKNYEELLMLKGIGPSTVRALALISELVYGEKADWRDPVKYSFAHGGKDGVPRPVSPKQYDKSIELMENALKEAELGKQEKLRAISRLKKIAPNSRKKF